MTDKFYLKEVCGEYKFYEEGDGFPLTEKQILNKLNENEQLKKENNELRKESYGNLDGLNYYQEQNGHLSSKISDLECENEQLKYHLEIANDALKENKLLKEKLNEILELTEMTGMIHLRKAEIKSIIKR